jgi:cellulose synthase/poly-beta-1,6-N-acetylglucosamine synthase-like glycosyltransferase
VNFLYNGKSVSIIIPAYNEEQSIARTIQSLLVQTSPPDKIIVIDDYSSDNTGKIAKDLGTIVLRPPTNQGSKAKAQNYALPYVETDYTVAIDADTSLETNALEEMIKVMEDKSVVAACSFVIPGKIQSIWERGRFIEYMFAFTFYKEVQEWYGKPLICSGCFSIYRTEILKEMNGWQTRTLAEDMDLTWSLYTKNLKVKFNGKALCYPIEPHDFKFLGKQLKRWSHGFIQNVVFHWKNLMKIPGLREQVLVGFADAITTGLIYFIFAPILLVINPILAAYLLGADILFIAVPVIWKGYKLKMLQKTFLSLPFYFILRVVNSLYFFEALISELLLNKSFKKYEKGH